MFVRKSHILVFILLVPMLAVAQRRIKYSAKEYMSERVKGVTRQILWDSVVYQQRNTTVFCDSSLLYRKENRMDSYGNVRIIDDSTTITGDRLFYYGNKGEAQLRDNVVYLRGEQEMYTNNLNYDITNEIAHYFNGGKLIDTTNVLTSRIAYYYAQEDIAIFYHNVELTSPDFVLKTDTLRYNTVTKVAYTQGPTEITSEDGTRSYSEGGTFRTEIKQSEFVQGSIDTEEYMLDGETLFFDDLDRYYKSKGNVRLTAKEQQVIITGDEGYYDQEKGISKIYGNPIMKRVMDEDTLYIAADTLVAVESEYDSLKRILAYPSIRLYRSNVQGIADSAAFLQSDSLIFLYQNPILWTDQNQISADTIIMEISETEIKEMRLRKSAFMISLDSILNFNQITGRTMNAYFKYNELHHVEVNGNCESIFHSLEEGDSTLLGLNKLLCGSMTIRFFQNQIDNFTVYTNPEGRFIPPHEITSEDRQLNGFNWQVQRRPELIDIYIKPVQPVQEKEAAGPDAIPVDKPPSTEQDAPAKPPVPDPNGQ